MTKDSFTVSSLETNRDVLLFEFEKDRVIVIGCDSSGGIGPKPLDKVRVDGFTLGRFTARVALMEVLSTGAKPVCLVNTLSVEPEPTGAQIIKGVRDEAKRAGLDPALAVTGSSEKNVTVDQTGIGVTAVGIAERELLRIGHSRKGDVVVALGVPCFGSEVLSAEREGKVAEMNDLLKLLNLDSIHEIIPVGSQGIAYEVGIVAQGSNLSYGLASHPEVDLHRSAGPATAILATLQRSKLGELRRTIDKPLNVVGHLLGR